MNNRFVSPSHSLNDVTSLSKPVHDADQLHDQAARGARAWLLMVSTTAFNSTRHLCAAASPPLFGGTLTDYLQVLASYGSAIASYTSIDICPHPLSHSTAATSYLRGRLKLGTLGYEIVYWVCRSSWFWRSEIIRARETSRR